MICILHIERVLKGKSKQIKQRLVKYTDVFRKNQHRNCFSRISKTDSLCVCKRASDVHYFILFGLGMTWLHRLKYNYEWKYEEISNSKSDIIYLIRYKFFA